MKPTAAEAKNLKHGDPVRRTDGKGGLFIAIRDKRGLTIIPDRRVK